MSPVRIDRQRSVAIVTIDNPPVNVFNHEVRAALKAAIDELSHDRGVHAIVLIAAGKTFVAGADLEEFNAPIKDPHHRDVLNLLEAAPKPCIAAVHGSVLGAGVEIAAACHYRVCTPTATFGMPEVTLGIVPGAGGTQRLPRMMGLNHAARLLLTGRPISATEALDQGLVDEIASQDLLAAATAAATRLAGTPFARTCDRAVSGDPRTDIESALKESAKLFPRRSAPQLIADALRASTMPNFSQGIQAEADLSERSLSDGQSRALRHLFFAERVAAHIPGIKAGTVARPINHVAVVGAGTMGGGITMALIDAGIPVTLLDVSEAALHQGLERVKGNFASSVKRGRLTQEQATRRLALISLTVDYAGLGSADLVIEAAPEKMTLKRETFRKLDQVMKGGAILATNTSTLNINAIAAETSRPQDVVGLHFFSPANIMRLLEIVRTDTTADDVIVTAFDLARRLKKIGVLSRICYGFIGNRMMDPYQREAEKMLLEGASPSRIDHALEEFGMAMGILAVHDMAGIDVGEYTRRERETQPPGADREFRGSALLFEKGWLGQKTGQGFYRYADRQRQSNPDAEAMFRDEAARLGIAPHEHSTEEIQQRCLLALANEGARLLGEGIALRSSDVDVVYTSGYGFPREKGGPMYWADTVGVDKVLAAIQALQTRFGSQHWTPAPLLQKLAAEGGRFSDMAVR